MNPKCDRATPQLHPVSVPSEVVKQIGVDINCLPEANGFRYMMVAIDYFSKWSEAKPLQNKSAISVARSLFELICRFVASPSRLMTRHENLWTPGECKLYKGITNFIHRYSGVQIPGSTYYMLHGFIDSWLSVNFKAASTSYSGAVVCFFSGSQCRPNEWL